MTSKKVKLTNKYALAWMKSDKLQFDTLEELNYKIGLYFQKNHTLKSFPKVSGLQIHLGVSKYNLYDWQRGKDKDKALYSNTIKTAYKTISMIIDDIAANPNTPRDKIIYLMYYKKAALKEYDKFYESTRDKIKAMTKSKIEDSGNPSAVNFIEAENVANVIGVNEYMSVATANELAKSKTLTKEQPKEVIANE